MGKDSHEKDLAWNSSFRKQKQNDSGDDVTRAGMAGDFMAALARQTRATSPSVHTSKLQPGLGHRVP